MKEISSCALAFVAKYGTNGDIMYGTPSVGEVVTMDLFYQESVMDNNRAIYVSVDMLMFQTL